MLFFGRIREQAEASPLWHYWLRLLPRERLALLVLFVVILLMTFRVLVWLPMMRYVGEAGDYFEQQRSLNGYLSQNAQRIHGFTENSRDLLSQEQLQGAVTGAAQRHGLQIERLDRDDEALLVVMVRVEFDRLIMWLDDLQDVGGKVLEMGVTRASSGQVEARVKLGSGN